MSSQFLAVSLKATLKVFLTVEKKNTWNSICASECFLEKVITFVVMVYGEAFLWKQK